MKPTKYDIYVYQGASWSLELTFKDANGDTVDLSGYDGVFAIRQYLEADSEIIRLDGAGGGVVFSSTAPNIVIRMTDEETLALPTELEKITDWVYEFRMYEDGNEDYTTVRLIEGEVNVYPPVARDA